MPEESPSATILQMMQGAWVTQALSVCATLGIAEQLQDGPRTSAELAAATGANADSLHRLLRYLTGLGVFTGDDERGYALTPVGDLLRKEAPGSMHDRALSYGGYNYRAFGELLYTIRTGRPAFDQVFDMPAYEYLATQPELARAFDRQMQTGASFFARVPEAFDFSAASKVVDIAGGNGGLIGAILTAAPQARGVLLDAEHVVAAAEDRLRELGVLDRCELVGGSFFEGVPEDGDVYTLSRILHNWDDDPCLTLLAQCHRAMAPGATLLILERLIPEDGSPGPAVATDINMLTVFGGRERTASQYRALVDKAGFDLDPADQRPLPSDLTMLVAHRR